MFLFWRAENDVAFAAPDAVASSFYSDHKRMTAVVRLLLQLLLVDPRIVLEPVIIDRAFRESRPVNVRMNVRRRATMRVRAGTDRAEFVFAVRTDFHPSVQPRMTGVVLGVVIAGPVRVINPEHHSFPRRFSIRFENSAGNDEWLARFIRRRDHSFPRETFGFVARTAWSVATQGRWVCRI